MTRIIVHEILSAVFLNLLYTSIYSDGSRLYPELNPLVGESFKLVCKTDVTITSTITIKFPDGTVAGTCDPPTPPVPVYCANAVGYVSALNETENAITTSTNSLALDANGTWTCTYNTETVSYNLRAPIREIKDETFSFFPTSFTDNITSQTASISLSATYGCINLPVYFKWFVVDSASKKIDISGTSNAAENSSLCTSGFNEYTETKEVNEDVYSSSSVTNLDGSYRLGVEVHYTDEVTPLHSIKYFDTYFVFSSEGTNTKPDNDNSDGKAIGIGIGILTGILVITCIIVIVMVANRLYIRSTGETSGNCFLTFCQFIEEKIFYRCGNINSKKYWLLGFVYLVLYGVIVGLIVLLPVYYGFAGFQEGLVIGVGIVIVLVLSGICLLVVWMLKKFFNNDASERSRSQRSQSYNSLRDGTVTPHERGKSQKESTFDKRQQPDGHEHLTTGRPFPPRPDIASPQTGPFDSVNSENPNIPPSIDTLDEQKTDKKLKDKKKKKKKKMKDEEQDNNVLIEFKITKEYHKATQN